MCLDDFERRRPLLEQFIEFTAQVVCVTGSKGDPAGEKVLPDQGITNGRQTDIYPDRQRTINIFPADRLILVSL
jgi:hypothetical protein